MNCGDDIPNRGRPPAGRRRRGDSRDAIPRDCACRRDSIAACAFDCRAGAAGVAVRLRSTSSGEETIRPEEPALLELLEDLYDAEFDEAVADLAAEAETYVAELGLGESESDQARAEQMLEAWIEPLRRETQAMLLGLAEAFEAEDPLVDDRGPASSRSSSSSQPAGQRARTGLRGLRFSAVQEGQEDRSGRDQGGEGGRRRGVQDHADRRSSCGSWPRWLGRCSTGS